MPFSVSPILPINAHGTAFPLLHLLSHGVNIRFKMQHTLSIGLFTHSLEELLFCFMDRYCLTNESSNTLPLILWMSSFETFWMVSEWEFNNWTWSMPPCLSVSISTNAVCLLKEALLKLEGSGLFGAILSLFSWLRLMFVQKTNF